MHQINKLVEDQLDKLFESTNKLLKKLLEEKSPKTLQIQEKIELEINRKWQDFRNSLDYLCQNLNRDEQFKLVQFAEHEFNQRRRKFNQTENGKTYNIKLNPHTKRIVQPRKIESTESRLKQSKLHTQVLKELKLYWENSSDYTSDTTYLWGNLFLSFIYLSGCADRQHLIAIHQQLQDTLEHDKYLNCFRLYDSNYKKITNPLLLHYRVENSQYGNDSEGNKLYQWQYVFFNPYAQFMLQILKRLKVEKKEYRLQQSIEECIWESLNKIEKKTSLDKLKYQFKRSGFRIFNDVQIVLEFNPELSLDIFLSNVLQKEINTVALRPSELRLLWNCDSDEIFKSENQIIHLDKEQLTHEVQTAHRKLQTIPFELPLFNQKKSKRKKIECLSKRSIKEKRTLLYWKEIELILKKQLPDANIQERSLIEAQLRLIDWSFHLKQRRLKLSTIENYIRSFSKEFIFEVWFNKLNFNQLSIDDYESLYRQLLKYSIERDEKAVQRDLLKVKVSRKAHQSAEYRFGRLKDFHQFCVVNYNSPEVLVLNSSNFKHLQVCNARLVSPLLFSKLLAKLEYLSKEPLASEWVNHLNCLKLMYLLSYRTGIRLNEVRCLKIQDIICPELLYNEKENRIFNNITLHIQDNSYRRLKTQSANRQLPLKIVLLDNEFLEIQRFIQYRYSQYLVNQKDDLLFSVNHHVLTDQCISKLTVELFNQILGVHHGFSFHSLRHSAANYLAITLLGSKEMIKTYTDCSWVKAKKMRDTLFGKEARAQEGIIQNKWQMIATWMGHSSIEQTASSYLHVLDLLAIDRIYNTPCLISKNVLRQFFDSVDSGDDQIDLNRYIQQQKSFSFYHQETQISKIEYQQESKLSIQNNQLTPQERLINYCSGRLKEDLEAQKWMLRCNFMTTKWMDTRNFKPSTEHYKDLNRDSTFFDEFRRKSFKLAHLHESNSYLNFSYSKDKIENQLKEEKLMAAMEVLLEKGKLRKNFLHFQCRKEDDKHLIEKFIIGINSILDDKLCLEQKNWPININEPERTVELSFQRVNDSVKKNVTVLVMYNLMLIIMQEDKLWNG